MRKKDLLLGALGFLLGCSSTFAQPSSGVYRLVAGRGTDMIMAENYETRGVVCQTKQEGTVYAHQYWEVSVADNNTCTVRNVYTGRYIQPQTGTSQMFQTGDAQNSLALTAKGDKWLLKSGSYLHCDASYNVVNWWDANNSASYWTFEPVTMTADEISAARADYQAYQAMTLDKEGYTAKLTKYFSDAACTTLNAAYAGSGDAELKAAMAADGLPAALQQMAVKVKNRSWGTREQEFRIHDYKPYSDASSWAGPLHTNPYSYMNNPTGLYAHTGDMLYVFVGGDVPEGATLYLGGQLGFDPIRSRNTGTELQKGFNVVRCTQDEMMFFVLYTVNTVDKTKKVADFPNLRIHIEGGVVTGYWDKERHTDADYVDLLALSTHPNFIVKGSRHIWHTTTAHMRTVMPNKVKQGIDWWDEMTRYQQELMGICKDVADGKRAAAPDNLTGGEDIYPTYFNNLMWARCGDGLSGLYATHYLTNYYGGSENLVLNYYPENNDFDVWAPAHETGHMNQEAINMVGTTEASNNLFSNLALFRTGKHMSRGGKISTVMRQFQQHVPWVSHDISDMMRMYWQLYLYYHMAGNNKAFYPTLFKLLREDPIYRPQGKVDAARESLHFVEKCCEAAGEDLTEFFEVWGFFEPINDVYCGDYADFYVTAKQEDIDATKARIKTYKKKNTVLMFIEDRIKAIPRTDGISGNKVTYDVPLGQAGDLGHYTEFVNGGTDSPVASYVYGRVAATVTMQGTGGVGFKVYDSVDSLVAFSNSYTFDIPMETAQNGTFRIVAVNADGTEVAVSSVGQSGTAEQKLAALNKALEQADTYLNLKDETQTKVGYYKGEKLRHLQELVTQARQAVTDGQSASYVQLTESLSAEILLLKQTADLTIPIVAGSYYSWKNYQHGRYSMVNGSGGVVNNVTTNLTDDYLWTFVPTTTPDLYYLKNKGTGCYVGSISQSVPVMAEATDTADAVKYYVLPVGDGTFYMQAETRGGYQVIHDAASQGHQTVGWDVGSEASHWYITLVGTAASATLETVGMPGISTGIAEMGAKAPAEEVMYDLSGRRISRKPVHGIYIVNGKKVFVR